MTNTKKSITNKLTSAVLAVVMLFSLGVVGIGSVSAASVQENETFYLTETHQMQSKGLDHASVYMWNSVTNKNNGEFGSVQMKQNEGNKYVYNYTVTTDDSAKAFDKVIFTCDIDGQRYQTADQSIPESQEGNDSVFVISGYDTATKTLDGYWTVANN